MECNICKEKKKYVFNCDECNSPICKTCGKLTASEVKCLELKEGRVLQCHCPDCKKGNTYTLLHTIIEDKNELINSKEKTIKLLEQRIAELTERLNKDSLKQTVTYSQVVKSNKEAIVVVKPKDNAQNSNKTRETLQDKINPATVGAISRMKHIREGGVAICCSDEKSVEKLSKDVINKLGEEYEVKKIEKKNPKIKIFKVNPKDIENNENFIEKLIFQNKITTQTEKRKISIVYKQESRDKRNYNVIVELDPETYGQLNPEGIMYIGWKRCRFTNYVNIIQCYKCWKFGHMASKCNSSKDVCPKCAGEHKSKECNEMSFKCINCKHALEVLKVPNITYNHTAYDKDCELYKRIFNQLSSRYNYPEIYSTKYNEL